MSDTPESSLSESSENRPVSRRFDADATVAERIEDISAADGADVLENLSTEQAADVAVYLDPDTAARIFAEMDPPRAAEVLAGMEAPEASMVISAMHPDDRVDVLELLTPGEHDAIVEELTPADAEDVRNLEQYAPDSAGGIMTTDVTALSEDLTVGQAVDELRRLRESVTQMFYVYVIDRRRHLIGVLSMRDLILERPEKLLTQIMRSEVARVPVTMDQEQVARVMRRHNYLALPVVDDQNRLLGLITLDDVMDVIQEEATEDVQKMFGAGAEERLASPWQFSFKKRVWWLEFNLLTAFLAAAVIAKFDSVIQALPILAAYQTIVSGMGGNAGAQAMAVSIRGIALGEVDRKMLRGILYRELVVGVLTGLAIGLTTWICALLGAFNYHVHAMMLGMVVFLALTLNHINACITGVAIPFVMKWFGFDPAQSATIFATTFTDCGGFFLTLYLAKIFMHWLV
jgi:magnesium transporter